MNRVEILGVQIDNLTQDEVLLRIENMIRSGVPHQILTPAIEQVVIARKDPDFHKILQEGELVVPDGMPLVFAARWHNTPLKQRITGVDLVPELCRLSAERGYRVFFFGAEEGVAQQAAQKLHERFPGMHVAGVYSPPYRFEQNPEEEHKAIEIIHESRPDILLVALSCPRQERWIHRRKQELGIPVMIGIGGTFNFLTGREKRAPQWIQNLGLEGLYRFIQRPRDIWRRVLINVPYFFLLLFDLFTYRTQKRIAAWSRPVILVLMDAALAPAAFLLAIWFYFRSGLFQNTADPYPQYESLLEMPVYSELPLFVAILTVLSIWYHRLYERDKYLTVREMAVRLVKVTFLSVLLLIAFQFIFKNIYVDSQLKGLSRMVFGFFGIFLFFFLMLWRWGFMRLEHFLHHARINLDRIIIVGMNEEAFSLVKTLQDKPELGNLPLGFVTLVPTPNGRSSDVPILGSLHDLGRLLPARKVDEVLIADSSLPLETLLEIVLLCRQHKVVLSILPNIQALLGASSEIKRVGDFRVITVTRRPELEGLVSKHQRREP